MANFAANTGYAWNFIERLYAGIADRIARDGVATFVAYPAIPSPPKPLEGSAAHAVVLDVSLRRSSSFWRVAGFVRRHRVRVVYFTDRAALDVRFWWLRLLGVRTIIVHDHASGSRTIPHGIKRIVKWLLARMPGLLADCIVTVSDYVAERQRSIGRVPADRVMRVWNGVPLPAIQPSIGMAVRQGLQIDMDRAVIVCCCRATREKGLEYLLRAFDGIGEQLDPAAARPILIYVGDGPHMPVLRDIRNTLRRREDVFFVDYRSNVQDYLLAADICVVPSVWQEAFGLAVLEPMALGKPVIATRVGGIPEVLRDGLEGLLVPPADEIALARAIVTLLTDRRQAVRLGQAARKRVAEHFTAEGQLTALVTLVERSFSPKASRRTAHACESAAEGRSNCL